MQIFSFLHKFWFILDYWQNNLVFVNYVSKNKYKNTTCGISQISNNLLKSIILLRKSITQINGIQKSNNLRKVNIKLHSNTHIVCSIKRTFCEIK
jgi:hypothetical protein